MKERKKKGKSDTGKGDRRGGGRGSSDLQIVSQRVKKKKGLTTVRTVGRRKEANANEIK